MTRPLQFLLESPETFTRPTAREDFLGAVVGIFPASDRSQDRALLVNRSHFASLDEAKQVAAGANRLQLILQLKDSLDSRDTYLATDEGPSHSPRYDVVRAPRIGHLVSSSFNGDSYPEGEVVRVSASFRRVETSTGKVYTRRRQSGSWIAEGTWFMTEGHVRKTNWDL